jgi:hypothetical protein
MRRFRSIPNLLFARGENITLRAGHRGDRSRLALVEEDLGREITLAVARMMVVEFFTGV